MTSRNDKEWLPLVVVILLLASFAILTRSAALTKSATYEETLHAAAGWSYINAHDWRANPEEPPLAKLVSAFPHDPLDLAHSIRSMGWRAILAEPRFEWSWAVAAVFRSPLVIGDDFIQRARLPMLAFALALGGLIAFWAWKIGGPGAAIPALLLFCLSPDFIGHGSLVNGDVALAMAWLAIGITAWRLGERITLARITMLALAVACALLVSFSGLIALVVVAALLLLRATDGRPWPAGHTELVRPAARAGAALVLLVEVVAVCWVLVWCAYGLRYSSTADDTPLDFDTAVSRMVQARLHAADPDGPAPSSAAIASFPRSPTARFARLSQSNALLPEAWNVGLIAFERSRADRASYLLGQVSNDGFWHYYPVALLAKEPMAATVAMILAAIVALRWVRRGELDRAWSSWLISCLVVPPAIWTIVTVALRTNDGVRQLFPLLPFLFIATGVVAGRAMRLYGKPARNLVVLAGLILAAECAAAWPNYIAFFNAAAGGSRGGLHLLGGSNLDWGQDLKLLAAWQRTHSPEPLYLAWGGTADPTSYGIRYVNAFGAYAWGPTRGPMDEPGMLAIGASQLQRDVPDEQTRKVIDDARAKAPVEVLGGTIYLYRYEPRTHVEAPYGNAHPGAYADDSDQ